MILSIERALFLIIQIAGKISGMAAITRSLPATVPQSAGRRFPDVFGQISTFL